MPRPWAPSGPPCASVHRSLTACRCARPEFGAAQRWRERFTDTRRRNTSLVLNLASRAREHRITTGSGGSGDFLLQNIPRNHRLRTPTGVTAVNHHQIAFCDDHSCLVTKSRSQLANQAGNGISTVGKRRIVLDIVFREVALHDAAIPADEDRIHHLADEGLVGGSGA